MVGRPEASKLTPEDAPEEDLRWSDMGKLMGSI